MESSVHSITDAESPQQHIFNNENVWYVKFGSVVSPIPRLSPWLLHSQLFPTTQLHSMESKRQ